MITQILLKPVWSNTYSYGKQEDTFFQAKSYFKFSTHLNLYRTFMQ